MGKPDPDGGEQVTVGDGSESSVAVTEKVTGASKATLHGTVMFAGQEIVGGVLSPTPNSSLMLSKPAAMFEAVPLNPSIVPAPVVTTFGEVENCL